MAGLTTETLLSMAGLTAETLGDLATVERLKHECEK
jgi:hypothetical protein